MLKLLESLSQKEGILIELETVNVILRNAINTQVTLVGLTWSAVGEASGVQSPLADVYVHTVACQVCVAR